MISRKVLLLAETLKQELEATQKIISIVKNVYIDRTQCPEKSDLKRLLHFTSVYENITEKVQPF